jgi:hypothetical protein
MSVFPLVARVGCLRDGAIRLLEEWSPIPSGWTEPGLQTLWHFFCRSLEVEAGLAPARRPVFVQGIESELAAKQGSA